MQLLINARVQRPVQSGTRVGGGHPGARVPCVVGKHLYWDSITTQFLSYPLLISSLIGYHTQEHSLINQLAAKPHLGICFLVAPTYDTCEVKVSNA